MKKAIKFLLVFALLCGLLLLQIQVSIASSFGLEMSGLTEIDPSSHITTTAARATATDMTRGESAWLVYDSVAENITGDYIVDFEVYIDEVTANTACQFHVFAVSDRAGDGQDLSAGKAINIQGRYHSSGHASLNIEENIGAAGGGTPIVIDLDTLYYIRTTRVNNYAYLFVYSDSERTELVGTTNDLLTGIESLRYIQPMFSHGFSGAYPATFYVQNYIVYIGYGDNTITTLPATDIEFSPSPDSWFQATIRGNVTDDGGEPNTVAFYYQLKDAGEWLLVPVAGSYSTGQTYDADLILLNEDATYEYYTYGYNSLASDNGSILEFTVTPTADVPAMTTLAYPFSSDNNSALLYGLVDWDGNSSSNVTAWIQYREATSETWLDSTDNVTDLVTDSAYSCNVTGLSLDTFYHYRAVGLNNEGTGNATSYSSFQIMYQVTTPVINTLPITALTDETVRLWGYVLDDGNSEVFTYFQYRILGDTAWKTTAGYFTPESDNYSQTLINLSPNTTYEYRAYGWNFNPDYSRNYVSGDTMIFNTYISVSLPIMSTSNITYLSEGVISIKGTVIYDGGSSVEIYFQVREYGFLEWTETDYKLTGYQTNDEGTWYISGLVDGSTYEARAVGSNVVGIGYGNILVFQMSDTLDTGAVDGDEGEEDIPVIGDFAQIIEQVKAQFHLYGTMGTWAFMALILLVVAMIFGVAIVATPDAVIKRMVSIVWCLASIAVVGAFLFTGQLGLWPILIMVGGTVVLIFIVVGTVLSGRVGSNG